MPEPGQLPKPETRGALLGREDELGLLAAVLDRAHRGSPQVVGIEGAAGIGKTSLVRRFASGARASAVLWASGDPDETDLTWGVLHQLSVAADAVRVAGADHLGRLAEGLDPAADPLMVGAGLLRLLETDDVVVVIDDAHWADAQSLAAVRFALRRLVSEKVMVIVTYRPEDAGRLGEGWRRLLDGSGNGTRMRLGGLAAPDLAKLAETVAGRPLSERAAVRLLEQTSGHPLYARSLLEQVPLATLERTTGPLPAPVDLASAVAARYASIRQSAQELVAAASVIGRRCAIADLYVLSGLQDTGEAVAEAVKVGLLAEVAGAENAEVDFPHVLVRSAIYHDLSPERRRKLHARAALVTSGRIALGHRFAAATGPDAELAGDLERDARMELAARRLASGGQQLARSAQLTPPGPVRQARRLSAVEALLVAGDMASAAELAGDPASLPGGPWADYVSGYLALLSAQPQTAESLLIRAWNASAAEGSPDGAPADLRARIASQLAILAIVRVDYPAMLRFGEAAVAAAAEDWVGAFAWFARLIGLALAGRADEARALLAGLDEPGGPAGLEGLVARGMIRLWTDDLTGAYEDLSEVLRRAEGGEALRISQVTAFVGEAALRLGQLDEAVIHTELAVARATDSGWVWDFPLEYGLAACPRALRGDWPEAEAHAKTAAEWAAIIGTRSARAYAAQASAFLAKCRDDMAALERAARDLVANYDSLEPGTHVLGPVLAEALIALGRTEEARAALDDFRKVASAADRRSALMAVTRADAQLAAAAGNWDEARAFFQLAIDDGQELGLPLAIAETRLAFGRAAMRSGKRKEAVHLLTAARQACQALGAAAYAGIASRELSELGMSEPDSVTPGAELLTSTEGAVARLVAARLSNQEVALRLMMSVKTVEYHLTHIYAKLGVGSRRELAGRLETAMSPVPGR